MHARSLFLGLAWMALAHGQVQEGAPPAGPPAGLQEPLDGGLLEPQWFGPGPVWSRNWRVDFFWMRPGARWDQPTIYLQPWEEPRFLSERGPLDYASGWAAAEFLQGLLQTRLRGIPGLRLAASPEATPYHAMGRIVEATYIRQGSMATFGPMAGFPSFTWDFKVVDVRTGTTLLASHHRSLWAPASTWITALEAPLREMAGMPRIPPWEAPPDRQEREDGSWTWTVPGLRLPPGCLGTGTWTADTDTGGLWKAWTNGTGAFLAAGAQQCLRARLSHSTLAKQEGNEPAYVLTGQVFSTPKFLKVRYRAQVTEIATGRVVARSEIRAPMKLPQAALEEVAERVIAHLEACRDPLPAPSEKTEPSVVSQTGPSHPPPPPTTAWEGLNRLVSVRGPVDKAWVSPALHLPGHTLQVADWSEPTLNPKAADHDRLVAKWISKQAPAWLYGALAAQPDRGFRIHRREGDLRLEGRVVQLDQPDRNNPLTALGGALSFGLSLQAEGRLQLRVLEVQTGTTLALVEHDLVSFQMASDGIPYKTFKWLAQGLVSWLLKEGCRSEPAKPAPDTTLPMDPAQTPPAP